ncbi:hypothetical protein M409DRAFT_17920 [Zasmidium cellare ATCC 36951]|uniref:Uncharacterized protein n=1 Tax=Zasmidium cellare ATCC 36951 TaxID=1080233 RepID=A0A6A6CY88_ZASCE|nr:uncharacterized protein M409DRAFT_17920 [Zasmidium cellare ATCC 36951]KAF2171683.1 hypothetical protein M409DRAFT_17920 [Zasmidium cellare ATCC 36951]
MSRILALPFQAWASTSSMMRSVVEASNADDTARRGDKWRTQKQEELGYVGITSALIAGTVSASFSWSNVERAPTHNTLQKIAFLGNGPSRLRQLLQRVISKSESPSADPIQHFIWQTPIMLLNIGIFLYVVGLLGLVFSQPLIGDSGSQSGVAVKVVFAVAAAFTIGCYLVAWLGVSRKLQSFETEVQPTNGRV